jgi:HK97 family phage portal protein
LSLFTRSFRAPDPPASAPAEQRNYSPSDPRMVELFGGAPSVAGVNVSETSVLGLSSTFRAVSLIAGGIATLPLRTVQAQGSITQRVPSWLDKPYGPLSRFEIVETTLAHLLLMGNAYLAHIYGGADQLIGVTPIHPHAVAIDVDNQGRKTYRVSLANGTTQTFDDTTLTHIKGLSLDGIRGLSPISLARNGAFGTAIAADRSAASLFGNGPSVSAIAVFDDDVSQDEAKALGEAMERGLTGQANAGRIGFINRNVQIHPFTMSNEDSQWIQAREFQISDIARLFGVPSHLIGLEQKNSSWGSGISEMSRGFARYTLMGWTSRVEERLSLLLPGNQKAEFDYSGFLQPDPETEISSLIAQVQAGLITRNEARSVRNLPPLPGGDELTPVPPPPAQPVEPAADE